MTGARLPATVQLYGAYGVCPWLRSAAIGRASEPPGQPHLVLLPGWRHAVRGWSLLVTCCTALLECSTHTVAAQAAMKATVVRQ